jgi:hypothetical protein
MPGQSVTLTPEGQNACKLTGKVVWCQESETTSHVMSSARYTHRFGMEFTFKDAAEQAAVEKFINDLLSL